MVWSPLVVCGITNTSDPNFTKYGHMCGFSDLIVLTQNIITDLIVLSTIIVVGVLIYHGMRLITSQGNTTVMTNAKKGLLNVVKGYVVILVAWVVIYTILNALIGSTYTLLSKP